MGTVIGRAAAFAVIIVLGYSLRRIGFFREEHFYLLSRIVLKITLPAAIVANFSKIAMAPSLLVMCALGLLSNIVMVAVGYLANRGNRERQAFGMINMSGYNIGNFALPFIQSFLGPVGFAATSLFDAGNSVMCTGVTYTVTALATGTDKRPSARECALSLISSFPFDTYVVMTLLVFLNIKLPSAVLSFAETAGGANAFLAMLMIGIGFEIQMDREHVAQMAKVLGHRYVIAIILSAAAYLWLPFPLEVRQALSILALAPVASVGPAFTGKIGGDVGLASAVNSMSIVISIMLMTAAMIVIL